MLLMDDASDLKGELSTRNEVETCSVGFSHSSNVLMFYQGIYFCYIVHTYMKGRQHVWRNWLLFLSLQYLFIALSAKLPFTCAHITCICIHYRRCEMYQVFREKSSGSLQPSSFNRVS